MRKRDRILAFLAPSATRTRSVSPGAGSPLPPPSPSSPVQQTPRPGRPGRPPSLSATTSIAIRAASPVQTATQNPALEKAVELQLQRLPEVGRVAFEQEIKALDEQALLSKLRAYDAEHKDESFFRPHAERLTKTLNLLNRLMGGVSTGIQADPAVSAIVVGAVRVAIDLGLHFARFFPRLTDMVCELEDYLGPLAEHSRAADFELVESAVVNVYTDILDFSWKARCVFVDTDGRRWRWTSFRAFMRQHWDTFEAEFVSIKEAMRHHLDVLQHSVQATHFNAFRNAERRKERSEFLTWVSDFDFEEVHQGIYAKKHKGTADWLIRESKFQQWMLNPHSSLLWCNGKPGIGKSILSANVLEHITAEFGLRKGTAICFAYYDYRDTRLADVTQIIATLIKQLCQKQGHIPDNLLQIKRDGRSRSLVGSLECFLSLAAEGFSEVFVVFDALDECPKQNRQAILGFIAKLVTRSTSCRMKVFVTSRRETDIAEAFSRNHVPTVQILAEDVAADIKMFVRSKVDELRAGKDGKVLYVTSDELTETIVETLARKADGMFLWVNLQLDNLCRASEVRRDREVESALNSLPNNLPQTYVRILDRIKQQHTSMRDLALKCLAWTFYARRPLSNQELQHALVINSDCAFQDLQVDSLEVIVQACGNLLEEANGRIRPIHYTVQEFFTSTGQGMPQHSLRTQLLDSSSVHERLGSVCLAYMHRTAFDAPTQDAYDLYQRLRENDFAGYAYQNFDYHITNCNRTSPVCMNQLEKLLQHESTYLAAVLQMKILKDDYGYAAIVQRFNQMDFVVTPSTIVYSTSLYNIPTIQQRWVDYTPPVYALHLAASAGLIIAVVRLLEAGCDVDQKDSNKNAPLYYACINDDLDVLNCLISKGADVNAQGGYYGNALQAASAGGHEQVVKMLLDKDADVNAQGGRYLNPTYAAAYGGHTETLKLLVRSGSTQLQDCYGRTLLWWAAAGGKTGTVETLIHQHNIDPERADNFGRKPLWIAVKKGHGAVSGLLQTCGELPVESTPLERDNDQPKITRDKAEPEGATSSNERARVAVW
ncbi:hypothetical protein OPT61_g7845 [Boeremia exigua]|uniref:Uncharacterized protein n=1 Tax=Boeremia exigua TaxID=749465 RepID=A0ACC2I1U0_9PLEO|nr:hypothetical protein OPT61_g7845 [Boeremia exigua]